MNIKRTFILGDTWLYYKLYCGARTSDVILTETIKPLVNQLLKDQLISKWFFIRYNDPEFHIRIRFHLNDVKKIGEILLAVKSALQLYVDDDIIYKIQTDNYQREIERYGSNTMEVAETLFYSESTMLLKAIDAIEDDDLYFLFILKAIDQLLNNFGYRIKEKLDLATINRDAYKREFSADRTLNKQLDKKYRDLKGALVEFLETTNTPSEYEYLEQILKEKEAQTSAVIKKILKYKKEGLLELPLPDLLSSYIHMLVNRAFRTKQRFYELVSYDFLTRYYKLMVFKEASKTK